MSLKAKIEAIIYATESPVTVEQITALVKDSVVSETPAPQAIETGLPADEGRDGDSVLALSTVWRLAIAHAPTQGGAGLAVGREEAQRDDPFLRALPGGSMKWRVKIVLQVRFDDSLQALSSRF